MKLVPKWRVRKPADDEKTAYVSERFGVRTLHIGSDTVQSAMRLARPYDLELSYTRSMMAFLLFVPNPRHVLMIGLGGGSLAKFVHRHLPAARVTAVEVSAQVVAIARQYFHVPPDEPRFSVLVADGAQHVEREDVSADVIALDGYVADAHAEELTSRGFYAACRRRLASPGMLVVNLWGGDRHYATLLGRIRAEFPDGVLCLPAARPGNVIVLAFAGRREDPQWKDLVVRAQVLKSRTGLEYDTFVEALREMNPHDAQRLHLGTPGATEEGSLS